MNEDPPRDDSQYTPAEVELVRRGYSDGHPPDCPRCGSRMTQRAIGGGSFGLGYARRREWLICPGCKRSALFDLKRGTRN